MNPSTAGNIKGFLCDKHFRRQDFHSNNRIQSDAIPRYKLGIPGGEDSDNDKDLIVNKSNNCTYPGARQRKTASKSKFSVRCSSVFFLVFSVFFFLFFQASTESSIMKTSSSEELLPGKFFRYQI
jgi:hypothetical protein